jgi:hypothetical protein
MRTLIIVAALLVSSGAWAQSAPPDPRIVAAFNQLHTCIHNNIPAARRARVYDGTYSEQAAAFLASRCLGAFNVALQRVGGRPIDPGEDNVAFEMFVFKELAPAQAQMLRDQMEQRARDQKEQRAKEICADSGGCLPTEPE